MSEVENNQSASMEAVRPRGGPGQPRATQKVHDSRVRSMAPAYLLGMEGRMLMVTRPPWVA